MRVFSYLFHIALAIFMLGVSVLALSSQTARLNFELLPWEGDTLVYLLLGSAVAGIVFVLLAIRRIFPVLFFAWTIAVFAVLVKGYLFGRYNFADGGLGTAAFLILGALLSIAGSWTQVRRTPLRERARVAV